MDRVALQGLRLDLAASFRQGRACKACGGFSPPFDSVDFHKICSQVDPFVYGFSGQHVHYHRCVDCGFVFTADFDDWSPEDFAGFVYNQDYVLTDGDYDEARPAQMAAQMSARLGPWRDLRILDYGSGSGGFGARMRAAGTRVENYDPFSSAVRPEGRFDLITCFEVIEHSTAPAETIADMASFLAEGGVILFSQTLQPADIGRVRASWWYIGPRNGHVSIYTADALAVLAARCGLAFHRGDGIFAFGGTAPSPASRHLLGQVGAPHVFIRLGAPGETEGAGLAPDGAWQGLEQGGPWRFRWTASRRVTWHAPLPQVTGATVRVVVPFVQQVVPGFAAACALELGGQPVEFAVGPAHLAAEVTLAGPLPDTLALLTPELGVPRDLHGSSDSRGLGLAVPVYPWVAPA